MCEVVVGTLEHAATVAAVVYAEVGARGAYVAAKKELRVRGRARMSVSWSTQPTVAAVVCRR